MLVALLCLAIGQLPEETEEARVRAIVDRLVGPTTVPGMPQSIIDQRRIHAERVEMVDRKRDEHNDDEDAPVVRVQVVALTSDSFDGWVFGNMAKEGMPEAWLRTVLRRWLIHYGTFEKLTETELAKLHLAGRGDVKQLFDEVARRRKLFEAKRHDSRLAGPVLTAANPLCNKFQNGPFGEGSLFAKTLNKILEDRKSHEPPDRPR